MSGTMLRHRQRRSMSRAVIAAVSMTPPSS
jgi:hypothetical protein